MMHYHEPVKEILHQIKYHDKPWLFNVFSKWVHRFQSETDLDRYDALVPVPLDPKRRWHRQFNQAALVAQLLRRASTSRSVRIQNLLVKKKTTRPQNQLARSARLHNLRNSFSLKRTASVRGKHILLVDDIFTTGSTMNECAKVLKSRGAESVDFFTLARA